MVLLFFIFVIVLNCMGKAHELVVQLNGSSDLTLSGVVWFFIGWFVAILVHMAFKGD